MKKIHFKIGVDKLRDVYGASTYPDSRLKLLWNEFQTVSEEHWIRAIENLVKESKFPPLAKELRTAISDSRERMWQDRKKDETKNKTDAMSILRSSPRNDPLIHQACQAALAAIDSKQNAAQKCDKIATELETELRARCLREGRPYIGG